MNSAWGNDYRAIKGLLQCPEPELNANTVDNRGRTPLYIASMMGHLQSVSAFLESSAVDVNIGVRNDGGTPFSIASENAHFTVMKALVLGQSNVNTGWCRDNWVQYLKSCDYIDNLYHESLNLSLMVSTKGMKYQTIHHVITRNIICIRTSKC